MNIDVANYIQDKKISNFDEVIKNEICDRIEKDPEVQEILQNLEKYRSIRTKLSEE